MASLESLTGCSASTTYDGTTVRLHIRSSCAIRQPERTSRINFPLRFGRWTPASEYWDGVVDEVRLYSRSLSQGEVQTDMTVPVSPANQAPTATLTAPANGATFTAPASITMTATASDADGSVARVEFYNGTTLLAFRHDRPYARMTWSNVAAGTYFPQRRQRLTTTARPGRRRRRPSR